MCVVIQLNPDRGKRSEKFRPPMAARRDKSRPKKKLCPSPALPLPARLPSRLNPLPRGVNEVGWDIVPPAAVSVSHAARIGGAGGALPQPYTVGRPMLKYLYPRRFIRSGSYRFRPSKITGDFSSWYISAKSGEW